MKHRFLIAAKKRREREGVFSLRPFCSIAAIVICILFMTTLSGVGQPASADLKLWSDTNFIYHDWHDCILSEANPAEHSMRFNLNEPSLNYIFIDTNSIIENPILEIKGTTNYCVTNVFISTNYTGRIQVGTIFYRLNDDAEPFGDFVDHSIILGGEGIWVTNSYELAFRTGTNPVTRVHLTPFEFHVISQALKRMKWDKP